MTESYEFEKAMQETIAKQDALINQLGEALLIHERKEVENPAQVVLEARDAYNNWKREQS